MACECVIDNGVREFPKQIAFVKADGFKSKSKGKIKCLGGKSVETGKNKVTINVMLSRSIDVAILLEWYIKEIDYRMKDFKITLPFFGITREYTVKMLTELDVSLYNALSSSVAIELEVLDDMVTAIDENIYECIC